MVSIVKRNCREYHTWCCPVGVDYGVTNNTGRPNQDVIFEALDLAYESKIRVLDSAQGYGEANKVIADYHAARPHRFNVY